MRLRAVIPYLGFEPAYFLLNVAEGIADFADLNLYLQKTCRNYTVSEPNLSTPCDNERDGIEFVASINSRYSSFTGFTTSVATILTSIWCDKAANRPKYSILMLLLVRLLQLSSMCLQAHFWHWPAIAAVATEMIISVGNCVKVISIIYICCVSSKEDRTFRLTLLTGLTWFARLISSSISGYLLRHFGFFNSYILCFLLHLISIIHAAIFMKEFASEIKATKNAAGRCTQATCEFFDLRSIIQAFKLVLGKRMGNERIVIILLSSINLLSFVTYLGEKSVFYLYLRYRFSWNEEDYSIYTFYKMVGINVGTLICLGITKYFKVTDCAMGMFAALWDIIASLGFFFAKENWQLYLAALSTIYSVNGRKNALAKFFFQTYVGTHLLFNYEYFLVPLFDIFRGFAMNVCDSTQSKFFKNEEYGQLNSVQQTLNILAVISTTPVYNYIFTKTMNFAPACIFILSMAVNIIICILYGTCHLLMKRMPNKD